VNTVGPIAPSAALLALASAAAIAAFASALLLHAGRLERRGLPASSRALARRAGLWMAGGTILEVTTAAMLLFGMPPAARGALLGGDPAAAALVAVAVAAALASGFTGLLAGLSGKPRPSGEFAAGLQLLALAAAVLARLRL